MSGPIVRKYGFPNHDKIFGERPIQHGLDDSEQPGENPEEPGADKSKKKKCPCQGEGVKAQEVIRHASGPGDLDQSDVRETNPSRRRARNRMTAAGSRRRGITPGRYDGRARLWNRRQAGGRECQAEA